MAATVLICDDAMFMRRMIRDVLEQGGYNIIGEAGDGLEAIEQYKELTPDLMTLDVVMPEKNGLEVVEDVIAIDSNARILVCSAMGQQALITEAIQNGAKDYIIKPFQPPQLLDAAKKVLS